MTLACQTVCVAKGSDEERMPVFDDGKRLVTVRTHISAPHDDMGDDDMGGYGFLEAVFGRPMG